MQNLSSAEMVESKRSYELPQPATTYYKLPQATTSQNINYHEPPRPKIFYTNNHEPKFEKDHRP